jgi:glycosyltransferase involved in cell wall biosynthesis
MVPAGRDRAEQRVFRRAIAPVESARGKSFRIGHLSNLTMGKGLLEVMRAFADLLERGCDVQLHLAGPCSGSAELNILDEARAEYGPRLRYAGTVNGAEKIRFYQSIDVFLFPSTYRNESWGMVLNEVMLCGVPPISLDRACIRHVIGDAGIVVPGVETFVAAASQAVRDWIDDDVAHDRACAAAIRRGHELRAQAAEGRMRLTDLIVEMTGSR